MQKIIENIIQSKKVESFPFSSNSVTDEDRPIQAKGAYELNDDILSKAQKMT